MSQKTKPFEKSLKGKTEEELKKEIEKCLKLYGFENFCDKEYIKYLSIKGFIKHLKEISEIALLEGYQSAKAQTLKEVETKEIIKLQTNTAFLLNDWFKEPTIWKKVREFIEEKHEEHWNGLNDGFVEVTFKFKPKQKVEKLGGVEVKDER